MSALSDFSIRLFLVWIFGVMPCLTWLGYRRLKSQLPLAPAPKRFLTGIVALLLTGLFALQAARSAEIELSFRFTWQESFIGLIYLIALAAGLRRGLGKRPASLRRAIRLYGTSNPFELTLVMLLALNAGIWEEISFRGVLYGLFVGWGGSKILMVFVCSVIFGAVHLSQGWRGMLFATLLALYFHVLVVLSGSLLVPIVVHAAYDAMLFAALYKRPMPSTEVVQAAAQSA